MIKILVTGAYGQLGSEINHLSKEFTECDFTFTDLDTLSLIDDEAVNHAFANIRPDVTINCAAYTAVDKAESDQVMADAVNHLAVGTLARCCKKYGSRFVHVSTDYVFEGNSPEPLTEEDPTNPISMYGKTKLAGEKACILENPDSIIIRTAWVYSSFGKNFVKTMLYLMKEREEISVVADQVGSPTYARDLARVIMEIIVNPAWHPGIYHYTNEGRISWYDFACDIKRLSGLTCTIKPIQTPDYPTPAARPAFSLLNKDKIYQTYNVSPSPYLTGLEHCLELILFKR